MWTKVAEPGAVAEKALLRVKAGDKVLALACLEGQLSAIDDRCPHFGASLSDGEIEGGVVVCPWHYGEYDLRTGQCVRGSHQGVKTYPVEIRADGIFVNTGE
jgi:pyruvate oxidase